MKKLIEVALPIKEISLEADREKMARTGRPSTIHLWWSRKTLAEARAVTFASLVDDPSAHPEIFESKEAQDKERNRLINLIQELIKVENNDNQTLIGEAIQEIRKYSADGIPAFYDPFAGGASIPLEAQRFGIDTYSSDLNPVATMINKALLEIPSRFAGKKPVRLQEGKQGQFSWSGTEGLAEDVRAYGQILCRNAFEKLKYQYPSIEIEGLGEKDIFSWIWARTVKCPNPTCDCNIPLAAGFDLSKKKGSEAWAEPVLAGDGLEFKIHHEKRENAALKAKMGTSAVFKCPKCGEITTDAYIREAGKNHGFRHQLMAVVADDGGKHIYLEPDDLQIKCADVNIPEEVPHGELPLGSSNFGPTNFGLLDYSDLYTNRQLLFLTTVANMIRDIQKDIEADAIKEGWPDDHTELADGGMGARAYSQAVAVYLGMSLSKLTDRSSALTSWDSSAGGKIRNVFSRAAMPMIWDYAETNPFYSSSGSLEKTINAAADAIEKLPAQANAKVFCADAAKLDIGERVIIATEPPFYDRADYANLSDFFYVWLRYTLKEIYPELFRTITTPKDEELITAAYRFDGDKDAAKAHYIEGIRQSICLMEKNVASDYPSNISFFYKRNSLIEGAQEKYVPNEWDEMISAIADAGLVITASWPVGRAEEKDIRKAEIKGIPITVILRKKDDAAEQTTRRRFVVTLKRELPVIIENLKQAGVLNCDLRCSAVGPAWNIFTRYQKVIDADGSKMSSYDASYLIEQELDACLSAIYNQDLDKENEEV